MSEREQIVADFVVWLRTNRDRWSAPYGILESLSSDKKYRCVTFGVARISDIMLRVYSKKYFIIQDSRYGSMKLDSIEAVQLRLSAQYNLER